MKVLLAILLLNSLCAREVITFGLEEIPPLLIKDGSGILNKLLREVEKETPYKFTYSYMTYSRALKELRAQRVDIVGITPKGLETDDFYGYAMDLNWSFQTWNVLYLRKEHEDRKDLNDFHAIGTLPGNEEFMSSLYSLPQEKFQTGLLPSLMKMLEKKRIDGVLFESHSSRSILKKLGFKDIVRRRVSPVKAGFAINRGNKRLQGILNQAFSKVGTQDFLEENGMIVNLSEIPLLRVKGKFLAK